MEGRVADSGAMRRDWHGRRGLQVSVLGQEEHLGAKDDYMLLCAGVPVLRGHQKTSMGSCGTDLSQVGTTGLGPEHGHWSESDPATRNSVGLSGYPGAL